MTVNSKAIISVEDSDTDFMALQYALQSAGVTHPIERCASGQLAFNVLLDVDKCPLSERTSLILLDLNLPGIDGRDLLRALRERDPDRLVPVVVLTTSSHPRDIADCYAAGADAYLVKPFELDDWHNKVGAIAGYWLRRSLAGDAEVGVGRSGVQFAIAASTIGDRARLNRAIESQVIPRLLLAFADGSTWPFSPEQLPSPDPDLGTRVAELARLVMEHDVRSATDFVEVSRAKGDDVSVVFNELIAPAASLVGEMWKSDKCDFSQFSRAIDRLQKVLLDLGQQLRRETIH